MEAAWAQARESLRHLDGVVVTVRTRPATLPVVRYVLALGGRVAEVREVGPDEMQVTAIAERGIGVMASLLAGLGERADIIGPPELLDGVIAVSRSNLTRYATAP